MLETTWYITSISLLILKGCIQKCKYLNINYILTVYPFNQLLNRFTPYILTGRVEGVDREYVFVDVRQNSKNSEYSNESQEDDWVLESEELSVQSAGNPSGTSETTRQLSEYDYTSLTVKPFDTLDTTTLPISSPPIAAKNIKPQGYSETTTTTNTRLYSENDLTYIAGALDGGGSLNLVKNTAKNWVLTFIQIKVPVRDVKILQSVKNKLNIGRIEYSKNNPSARWVVSTKQDIIAVLNLVNGKIRLKVDSFKNACIWAQIDFKEANYTISSEDSYFAGLVDTDGSIVFNYTSNRIECILQVKQNQYTDRLDFNHFLKNQIPYVSSRANTGRKYSSITFRFQNVGVIVPLYEYFIKHRLYSDLKYYRIAKTKRFIEIRHFYLSAFDSVEYKIYSRFLENWIKYCNPTWEKTPFVQKLNLSRENS